MSELLRIYAPTELGNDGYPYAWDRTIKGLVREQAGNRCLRCRHPYEKGEGEWSRCDEHCQHGEPARCLDYPFAGLGDLTTTTGDLIRDFRAQGVERRIEAQWRVLTTHHLNGDKADCRWWNLVPLCQRDHLLVQRKVVMKRPWPWEHTDWFQPYAAAFYAFKYLGEDLSRAQVMARQVELLVLGREREAEERMPV